MSDETQRNLFPHIQMAMNPKRHTRLVSQCVQGAVWALLAKLLDNVLGAERSGVKDLGSGFCHESI